MLLIAINFNKFDLLIYNYLKMKDLKKLILLFAGILLVSCAGNPNYEKT